MYSIAVMQLYMVLISQKYTTLHRIFDPICIDDTYRVSDQMYRDTYRIGSSKRYTTLYVSAASMTATQCVTPSDTQDTLLKCIKLILAAYNYMYKYDT